MKKYCCCFKSRSYETYNFRFKKIGFDHTTDDKAVFDEFYLVDYVYGSFSKSGDEVMNEAHLLSHFNHARLANPINPHHVDDSIRDLVMSSNLLHNDTSSIRRKRKKHGSNSHEDAASGALRTTYYSGKNIEV